MKKIIFLSTLFFLVACGPSDEEKQNIAIITCNIMSESTIMDGAARIKEINSARDKINAESYLYGDDKIKEAIEYNICINLVLDDPEYESILLELKEKEREAEIKQREAERLKKEQERIAREERYKFLERQNMLASINWIETNKSYIESLKIKPKLLNIGFEDGDLLLPHTCKNTEGFTMPIEVLFKNGMAIFYQTHNSTGQCGYRDENTGRIYDFAMTEEIQNHILNNLDNLESIIQEVNLYISGVYDNTVPDSASLERKRLLDMDNYDFEWSGKVYFEKPMFEENFELYENTPQLMEYPFKYKLFPKECEQKSYLTGEGVDAKIIIENECNYIE